MNYIPKIKVDEKKYLIYKGCKITSQCNVCYRYVDRWIPYKEIVCNIRSEDISNGFLNLGECNDGGKLTSVNQAINQAKIIIDIIKT